MMLVNYQFPGPMIEANEGDTIVVHVDNQAMNATSIHWHGVYQNGTPHMDGTVGITQCPIAPGSKYTYEFTVAGQSGTYWWHAHYGVQSADGLHGPLIIHGRKEKDLQQLGYASDRVVLISDHYHDLSSSLLWQYLKPDMENAEPVPNGGLINGKSVQNCDHFLDRICDNSSAHVVTPSFNLGAGQQHRLRLINVGAFAEFQVQVDEHELAVTEVDGTDLVPKRYHRLHISPAQRYSVVVTADHADGGAFWLRARMITKCFTDPPENLQSEVRAVISYWKDGAQTGRYPLSKDWDEMLDLECKDMNASELVPADAVAAPASADAFFYLRANFEIGAYRLSRGFFNSSSWRPDVRSPTLLRSVDGLRSGNSTFSAESQPVGGNDVAFVNEAAFDSSRELVIQTTAVQTIDILVSNFDDGNHPLHLHGYKYFVLAQGHGYPPLTYVGADIVPEHLTPLYDSLDLSNPLRRDSASVEAFGWVLLRLVADNPGAWAFHCHLAWHSEAGLLMQFLTRTDELARLEVPEAHRRLCAASGIEKGMGPDDANYEELAR
jgi:FtsP/CotA-like multicopper oxidase with cupredoxin domain